MGQQRYKPVVIRGRLFQSVPRAAAPVPSVPPTVLLQDRVRPGGARRGRLFERRPARQGSGEIKRQVPSRRRPVATGPARRGKFFSPYMQGAYFHPGPLAPQLVRQKTRLSVTRTRIRILNPPLPNNVLPPGFQQLPPSLFRTAERLQYRSPRGRVWNYLFPNGLFPVPPPVVPAFKTSHRPVITPSRRGKFWTVIFVPVPPPGPGPLAPSMMRQGGTSSRYLRPRHGTVVPPPQPFVPPPPPPVNPGQGTDDDVGSSLGRRKWHWQHRAVKSTLPKSLVWEHR